MDGETPYAPPGAPLGAASGAVNAGAIDAANGTRPWVTLVAVLATILTALICLGAVVMAGMLALGGAASSELGAAGGLGAALAVFLVYGLLALVYGAIAWRLWRIRKTIVAFAAVADAGTLEAMLMAHRSFWRLLGMLALVALGLYGVGILLVVGAGLLGAFAGLGA